MNETDAQFLLNRARLHGYELGVRDGTLHFHPPRFEESVVQLLYDKGERSSLGKLDVTARTHLMGAELRASQIDPLKKEIFDLASREVPDPITKEVQGRSREPLVMARELASVNGRQPVLFLTGDLRRLGEIGGLFEQRLQLPPARQPVCDGFLGLGPLGRPVGEGLPLGMDGEKLFVSGEATQLLEIAGVGTLRTRGLPTGGIGQFIQALKEAGIHASTSEILNFQNFPIRWAGSPFCSIHR